jgi:hypothetical protein
MKKLLLVSLALCAQFADASWFGPKNYDECITTNMKGVTSDYAAKAIVASCLRMFPDAVKKSEQAKKPTTLGENELQEIRKTAKMTVHERVAFSSLFHTHELNIHNNTGYLITKITVTLYPESGGEFHYQQDAYIKPYSSRDVLLTLNKDHTNKHFKYNITSAEIQ